MLAAGPTDDGPDARQHPRALRRRGRRASGTRRRPSGGRARSAATRRTDTRVTMPAPHRGRRDRLRALALRARCVLAPLVGSTHDQPAARVRLVDPVRRQRRRADLLRRAAAAHARRRARRRDAAPAGVVFQGLLRNPLATPFTLGVSTGAALGAMLAITFDWSLAFAGISAVPVASFAGVARARSAIVYALARPGTAAVDRRAAARRRHDERVLLGADPVRAVLRRLRRHLPDPALADGRPRRQQLPADRRGAAARRSSRSRCSPGWRARSTC